MSTLTVIVLIVCCVAVAAAIITVDWAAANKSPETRQMLVFGIAPFGTGAVVMYVLRQPLGVQKWPTLAACFLVVWVVSTVLLSTSRAFRAATLPKTMLAAAVVAVAVCAILSINA
ncbi:MAG TPA: hypothetical protein VFF65_03440 [Phycisphaerales bacterium]|nr:hypothetical protein [Phycisphaerales bacterium]